MPHPPAVCLVARPARCPGDDRHRIFRAIALLPQWSCAIRAFRSCDISTSARTMRPRCRGSLSSTWNACGAERPGFLDPQRDEVFRKRPQALASAPQSTDPRFGWLPLASPQPACGHPMVSYRLRFGRRGYIPSGFLCRSGWRVLGPRRSF